MRVAQGKIGLIGGGGDRQTHMEKAQYCPVCTQLWRENLDYCPECEGVVLIAVYDWDKTGKWYK